MRKRWQSATQAEQRIWHSQKEEVKSPEYIEYKKKYWEDDFLALLPFEIKEDTKILEVGCGPTGIALALDKGKIYGLDPLMDYYLANFELPPYHRYINQKIEDCTLDEKFDVIFVIQGLEHLDNLRRTAALITDLVKDGGHLVLELRVHNIMFFKYYFRLFNRFIDTTHPQQLSMDDVKALFPGFELVLSKFHHLRRFQPQFQAPHQKKSGLARFIHLLHLLFHLSFYLKLPLVICNLLGIKYDAQDATDRSIFRFQTFVFRKKVREVTR